MLIPLLVFLAALLAGLALVVARQPADFRYARSVAIAAPPGAVFPHLNDLRRHAAWQPWVKAECDPAIERSYTGPESGVGATYAWRGNAAAGAGRMVVIESRAGELVRLREDYEKPLAASCQMEFALAAEGGATRATWTMTGRNSFLMKAIHLLMRRSIERELEKGLAALKALVEGRARA